MDKQNPYAVKTEWARSMRRQPTDSEAKLWQALHSQKLNGLSFRRQHPIAKTRFVADFCCLSLRLIVEVDGKYHEEQEQHEKDRERELLISELDYTFVRVTTDDVMSDLEKVLEYIRASAKGIAADRTVAMQDPPPVQDSPLSLPKGRGAGGVGA